MESVCYLIYNAKPLACQWYTVLMYHVLGLRDKKIKLYFDESVYSPEHTSFGTVLLADKLITDGNKPDVRVLDVGCGSGILGLSIKTLQPFSKVTLCDIDPNAIKTTRRNARSSELSVGVVRADLLPKLGEWEIMVANLPTFTAKQMETEPLHGPKLAYDGGDDPLLLYGELFKQAHGRTKALVCECQPKLQTKFRLLAGLSGWVEILSSGDSFAFIAG